MNFKEYLRENPRVCIPEDMKDFLEYATDEYLDSGDAVNGSHVDCEEDCQEEVENYIGDSMEAILLYKQYIEEKVTKKD